MHSIRFICFCFLTEEKPRLESLLLSIQILCPWSKENGIFPVICLLVHDILFFRGFEVFEGEFHEDHRVLFSLLNRHLPHLPCLYHLWIRTQKIPAVDPYFIQVFFLNKSEEDFPGPNPAENTAQWQNFLHVNKNTISSNDKSTGKCLVLSGILLWIYKLFSSSRKGLSRKLYWF